MISVSSATKTAYMSDSSHKQLTISFPNAGITYTNSDIVSESLVLEESINAGDELTFEGCIATKMQFKCAVAVRDLRGELVTVKVQADNTDTIALFRGYIDEQTNLTHEDIITEFTAYDVLYKVGSTDVTSWYNGLTFPITIKNLRNSLCTFLSITQKSATLVNDSLKVNKVDTKNQIVAIDVLKDICQANAVFGRIDRSGKLEYVRLHELTTGLYPGSTTYPSEETYPSNDGTDIRVTSSNYKSVTYEPFDVSPISAVYIVNQDGTKITSGNGDNVFVLSDNIIAQGCTNKATMATNLYNQVNWITYTPNEMQSRGFPWIECGDNYLFSTRRNSVRAYLLTRQLKGIQQMFDSFSAEGSENRQPYKETQKTQSDIQSLDIEQNSSDIDGLDEQVTTLGTVVATKATITQLNAVSARVSSIESDYITTSELNAVSARVNTIYSDYVSTSELNAVSGRVSTLESDHVTTNQLNAVSAKVNTIYADYVTANELSAVDGKIDTLSSKAITTENLSAQTINGSQITGLTIKASQITSGTISAERLDASTLESKLATLNQVRVKLLNIIGTGLTCNGYTYLPTTITYKNGSGVTSSMKVFAADFD